jgi:hypothetical protein
MTLRAVIRAVTPVGLIELRQALHRKRSDANQSAERTEFHDNRRRNIGAVDQREKKKASITAARYEDLVEFLVGRGVPENQIREGSMPLSSLEFVREIVLSKLGGRSPAYILHLGNFVGVSLAWIASAITEIHPGSLAFAIDPNIPHRGIMNPQAHVLAVLRASGLERNVIPITGYSLEKNISNDGITFERYDPVSRYDEEISAENILPNLRLVMEGVFDAAFIDGNHEARYLRNETENIIPLMKNDSWMVLDDVSIGWEEIRQVFNELPRFGLEPVATDGRVGIAKVSRLRTDS